MRTRDGRLEIVFAACDTLFVGEKRFGAVQPSLATTARGAMSCFALCL